MDLYKRRHASGGQRIVEEESFSGEHYHLPKEYTIYISAQSFFFHKDNKQKRGRRVSESPGGPTFDLPERRGNLNWTGRRVSHVNSGKKSGKSFVRKSLGSSPQGNERRRRRETLS